jgi:hypothetical protein
MRVLRTRWVHGSAWTGVLRSVGGGVGESVSVCSGVDVNVVQGGWVDTLRLSFSAPAGPLSLTLTLVVDRLRNRIPSAAWCLGIPL